MRIVGLILAVATALMLGIAEPSLAQAPPAYGLAITLEQALKVDKPFILEVRTRGDLPMPRTGYWDIADFLAGGNLRD